MTVLRVAYSSELPLNTQNTKAITAVSGLAIIFDRYATSAGIYIDSPHVIYM